MGDKGGRKNKHKSKQQSSDKHKQKERDKIEKQTKGQPEMAIFAGNAANRKK